MRQGSIGESQRILVVEGQHPIPAELRRHLTSRYDVETISAQVEVVARIGPDTTAVVTCLDIACPEQALVLIQDLRCRHPHCLRLVLADTKDSRLLMSAVNAGASCLIASDADLSEICRLVDERMGEAQRGLHDLIAQRVAQLATREQDRDLIAWVLKGLRNDTIARLSGTSEQVVKNRLSQLYRRLGISSRGELFQVLLGL